MMESKDYIVEKSWSYVQVIAYKGILRAMEVAKLSGDWEEVRRLEDVEQRQRKLYDLVGSEDVADSRIEALVECTRDLYYCSDWDCRISLLGNIKEVVDSYTRTGVGLYDSVGLQVYVRCFDRVSDIHALRSFVFRVAEYVMSGRELDVSMPDVADVFYNARTGGVVDKLKRVKWISLHNVAEKG